MKGKTTKSTYTHKHTHIHTHSHTHVYENTDPLKCKIKNHDAQTKDL